MPASGPYIVRAPARSHGSQAQVPHAPFGATPTPLDLARFNLCVSQPHKTCEEL